MLEYEANRSPIRNSGDFSRRQTLKIVAKALGAHIDTCTGTDIDPAQEAEVLDLYAPC